MNTQDGTRLELQSLEGHRRILGIVFIVTNALSLVVAVVAALGLAFVGVSLSGGPNAKDEATMFMLAAGAVVGCFALLGLPGIITGIGLLRRRPWSRMLALIMGCLALPSVPFGTALGIYAIWFYTQPGSNQVFE